MRIDDFFGVGSLLGIFHYEAQFYRCYKDKSVSGKFGTFHISCPSSFIVSAFEMGFSAFIYFHFETKMTMQLIYHQIFSLYVIIDCVLIFTLLSSQNRFDQNGIKFSTTDPTKSNQIE